MTVNEIVQSYLEFKTALRVAGRITSKCLTKAHYYLIPFVFIFGDVDVALLRRNDLRKFLAAHPEWASPHTINDACGAVVTAFRWAVEEGLIANCPYSKPKDLPPLEPRAAISGEEVRGILAHARAARGGRGLTPVRFRLALAFLWWTGIRTCELYSLDWSQLDVDRRCFELRGKSTHKTGHKRIIALCSRAWRLINWLRFRAARTAAVTTTTEGVTTFSTFPTSGPVFLNGRGRRWNRRSFQSLFRKHARAAGIRPEVSAYSCRHGFCCEALEAGVGERQLADYMGHATTKLISWYGRAIKSKVDYLRDVADRRNAK